MPRWTMAPWFGLCLSVLLIRGRADAGEPDLKELLATLARSEDATARLQQVPRLAASTSVVAARVLADLVRSDSDVRVREAAAAGLGESPAANALDLLLDRARAGGTRRVRQAVSKSLARHADAAPRLLALIENPRVPDEDRVLLAAALESFRDDATRLALVTVAHSGSPAVREAALRALARRRDEPVKRRLAMVQFLTQARDTETELVTLDAFEPAAHPDMRAAVERLATSLEPEVQEAANHFLARIRAAEARLAKPGANGAGAAPAPENRYAPADGPEDEGSRPGGGGDDPPWPRYDLVYAVDVTGSTAMTLADLKKRILEEATLIHRLGGSQRVGVVAYRDGPVDPDAPRPIEILPPTHSFERLSTFLEGLKPRGVDERGAAVAGALREALDRTPWRWEARREVQLLADSKCDDPRAAVAVVGFHYRADTTRTRVAYILRTRSAMPPEYQDLARAGGTVVAEGVK